MFHLYESVHSGNLYESAHSGNMFSTVDDPESAMKSLRFLKKLTGGDLDLDNVTLKTEEGEEVKEEDKEPTFKQTLLDFFKYK